MIEYSIFQGKVEKYECKCDKLDIYYNKSDSRCWTAVINPTTDVIYVTFNVNKYEIGDSYFDVISSDKTFLDVESDDIYDVIESLINKIV